MRSNPREKCYCGRVVDTRATLETTLKTTVLVVQPSPELLEATHRAAQALPRADVVACDTTEAPTRVAELWPFAIVMTEEVYRFDSAEFDALSRDANVERAMLFGAQQMFAQHRALFDLLEARAGARNRA